MSFSVMKRIHFCAGHRLKDHGGKCEHFHGHNYTVDVYVTGDHMDEIGRVMDFAELNDLFKGWIDEHWDHGFLLHEDDENGIEAIQSVHPCKAYVLPYNPTAENMARYLLEHVSPKLLENMEDYDVSVAKIVVWETPTSCAEAVRTSTTGPPDHSWHRARVRPKRPVVS